MQGETSQLNKTAHLTEIFSSLQGEGPYTGEAMTFVRFVGCGLGCRWCDTEQAKCPHPTCRIETQGGNRQFENHPNPVTTLQLNEWLHRFNDKTISVTGGEPLEHSDFLLHWLPGLRHFKSILLETNGVFFNELKQVIDHVDIVSMDVKLPSSAGCRPLWDEHASFLTIALQGNKDVYVKMVVTDDTSDKDIQDAIKLVAHANKFIPLIIQPVSPTGKLKIGVEETRLNSILRLCQAWLPNTQIKHQMHKKWGIL